MAQEHAKVAAKNIKLLMSEQPDRKLAIYKPPKGKATAFVSLGRRDGVIQLPFTTLSGLVPGMFKSGDLYVGKTRKLMGLQSW